MGKGTFIQNVDAMDIISFVKTKNKTFQAVFLNGLEQVLDKDSSEFKQIRKLYLDSTNNFKRTVITTIFGEVEDE